MVLLCLLGPMGAWLALGERGLIPLQRTEMERQAYLEKIRLLAKENQVLREAIHRFRTDLDYVESVVRKELCLIKENEIIYRFDREGADNGRIGTIPSGAQQIEQNRRSQREVGQDGKIK